MKTHFEIVNEKPETHKWWIYVHTTPCGMHYVGVSRCKYTSQRWQPNTYKTNSLWPYIERYGWDAIEHTVVAYIDDEKLALQYEDALIQEFAKQGTLINKQGSGGHARDNPKEYRREYNHEYYEENKDEIREYKYEYNQSERGKAVQRKANAKRNATPERKIYKRVHAYNQTHDPIETPLEAKTKYLETGYIPDYIKNDDL